jgi:hypothetical protein
MTKLVRVAAKGLKVAAFSISCRGPVRVADKEVTGEGKEICVGLATNIGNDSTDFDYCQGLL